MPAHLYSMIKRAYKIIGEATPIRADCGRLCGAACCQGDEDQGMLLFPGEAARLSRVPEFRVRRIRYMDGRPWFLTCPASCQRNLRPLSCRIFPLAPHVGEGGLVEVIPDCRGHFICPLADGKNLDPAFRRRVGEALRFLAGDPRMLAFMSLISAELDELARFRGGER